MAERERILKELLATENIDHIKLVEFIKSLIIVLNTIIKEDLKYYTTFEKIVFIGICSPLLWFFALL